MSNWPQVDEKYLLSENVLIIVQINGKKRGEFELAQADLKDQAKAEAKAKEAASKHLEGVEIKKAIYVPGKIISFVI